MTERPIHFIADVVCCIQTDNCRGHGPSSKGTSLKGSDWRTHLAARFGENATRLAGSHIIVDSSGKTYGYKILDSVEHSSDGDEQLPIRKPARGRWQVGRHDRGTAYLISNDLARKP